LNFEWGWNMKSKRLNAQQQDFRFERVLLFFVGFADI